MTPYVPGISKLPRTDFSQEEKLYGKTSDEYYEATQVQRRLERQVRKYKCRIALGEERGEDMTGDRARLGQAQKKVRQWCKQNKLPRQLERERAYGVAKQPRAYRDGMLVHDLKPSRYLGKVLGKDAKHSKARLVNSQVKAIDADLKDFPIVREMLESGTFEIKFMQIRGNIVGRTAINDNTYLMIFNELVFKNNDAYLQTVMADIKNGHFMPASKTGAKGYIAHHEMGHLLQRAIIRREHGGDPSDIEIAAILEADKEELRTIADSLGGGEASDYARNKKDSGDFFAECFANMRSGKMNVFGKAMKVFLERRGLQ